MDSDNLFWGFDDRGVNALLRLKLMKGYEYYVGYDLQEYGGRDEVLLIAPHREKTQAFFGQVRTDDDWSATLHLSAGLRYNSPSDAEARPSGRRPRSTTSRRTCSFAATWARRSSCRRRKSCMRSIRSSAAIRT